jgi:putative cardiolipin synthase
MRAGLAETAQRTLDLQYYTLHQDATTQLLIYRVLRAADRGVRVRLLIDDMYAAGRDLDFAALSSHPNIEVRLFNPFMQRGGAGVSRLLEFFGDGERLNRRMHNKLWIADNAAAIVGGRNLGDAYFDAGTRFNFSDLDLLAVGPVVRQLSRSFDAYWNSPLAVPVEAFVGELPDGRQLAVFERKLGERLQEFRDTVYARTLRETRFGLQLAAGQLPLVAASGVALYDPPSKTPDGAGPEPAQPVFSSRLQQAIQSARSELILITPYFIPSAQGLASLEALAHRGVRVRILTNSLASSDVPVVHAAYARVRPRLLAAGVELYEMRPEERPDSGRTWRPGNSSSASLHTKAIVVDRRQLLIGSMNLDPRSRKLNTEVAVLLDSPVLGAQLAARFDAAVQPEYAFHVIADPDADPPAGLNWIAADGGRPVRHRSEPASAWRRILSELLHIVTPEDFL